jgi:D-xylose transport system substrate-binding protein
MPSPAGRRSAAVALLSALLLALASCTPADSSEPSAEGTIALLLPETQTARYETSDRPSFEQVARARCPECTVLYANADEDAARQQEQAEAMIARGAEVLVLDAVDATAAVGIVADAARSDVAVIAYDRFIADDRVAYYVSFDSELIGFQQGRALLAALPERGPDEEPAGVLLVHGSPTDPNAAELRSGVHRALDVAGVRVIAEYDTPRWSPTLAQDWVTGQLTQHGARVDGVVAANDTLAGGVIAAFSAAGVSPIPPVTGQDAELPAVQRIVNGEQLMTVAKATSEQARTAAEVAVRVLRGEQPLAPTSIDGVPSFLLAPTPVGAEDVRRVIVQGRVHPAADICTADYAEACRRLGLIEEGAP